LNFGNQDEAGKVIDYMKRIFTIFTFWIVLALSAQAGKVTYVYTDPQGTTLAEADQNGAVVATYDYRPYGALALGQPSSEPGYTGHVSDPETGLSYMQARYYDSVLGRFLSVDPLGPWSGGVSYFNRFSYVGNNPVLRVDPSGKYFCKQEGGCPEFEAAYAQVKEAAGAYAPNSAEGQMFAKVLAYYGEKGKKNADGRSIYIEQGPTSMGNPAEISHSWLSGSDTLRFDFSLFKDLTNKLLEAAGAVSHEGQHGVDDAARRKKKIKESEETVRATERNAYRLQSFVNQASKANSAYGLWENNWPDNEVEWRRDEAVNRNAERSVEAWKSQ